MPSKGDGLSGSQRGYLRCLLHMGHVQAMMTQVDGWASHSQGACCTPFPTRLCQEADMLVVQASAPDVVTLAECFVVGLSLSICITDCVDTHA